MHMISTGNHTFFLFNLELIFTCESFRKLNLHYLLWRGLLDRVTIPLKSKLPPLVSHLVRRDLRLAIYVSRNKCLTLRDSVKRTFWNKLQAISL